MYNYKFYNLIHKINDNRNVFRTLGRLTKLIFKHFIYTVKFIIFTTWFTYSLNVIEIILTFYVNENTC